MTMQTIAQCLQPPAYLPSLTRARLVSFRQPDEIAEDADASERQKQVKPAHMTFVDWVLYLTNDRGEVVSADFEAFGIDQPTASAILSRLVQTKRIKHVSRRKGANGRPVIVYGPLNAQGATEGQR